MSYSPELTNQVENYNSLPWLKTYRGKSVLILIASIVLVIVKSLFSQDLIIIAATITSQLLIFGTMAWFVNKGKKWAIITTIILWTLTAIGGISGYLAGQSYITVGHGKIVLVILAIYFLVLYLFINTYRVEKIRSKNPKSSPN